MRRTRSSLAGNYNKEEDDTMKIEDEGVNAASRVSISSTSTHESSGYSTPLTSAVTTPAPVKEETTT